MAVIGKLGVREFKFDMRLPLLNKYMVDLPDPPRVKDWTNGVTEFGMMLNDKLGCCTISALGHQEQIWTLNASTEYTPSDEDILEGYETFCNYDPNDSSTDQGGVPLDILKQWYATPGLFAGRTLTAFAPFQPPSKKAMYCTISYLGGAYLAFNLPKCIEAQGTTWEVPKNFPNSDSAPGSLGGHMVMSPAYDGASDMYKIISWGQIYYVTQAFINAYCIQGFALVSQDWIETSGVSPSGFDLDQLKADLEDIDNLTS